MLKSDWHKTTQVVILAAGDGKRMQSNLPKVLHLINGKPIIDHVVTAVEQMGLSRLPVVVVSGRNTLVQDALGGRARFAIQAAQLGTGHAVSAAEDLWSDAEQAVVLYGDMPFITPGSIQRLVESHVTQKNMMTFMTANVQNFEGQNVYFFDFGRIVRNGSGGLLKNVQKKDATLGELAITEVDTSYMCFSAPWLATSLPKLIPNNVQKEFYLTDLLALALKEGAVVGTVPIDSKEAIGINTKEQLDLAEKIVD